MPRRPPLPPEALSADGEQFYALLNGAQDVSVVVVAVSYIDACLASLLSKYFLPSSVTKELLDSGSGALGSFSARAKLAYVLALIDKPMFRDLQVLSELRNDVAHSHFALKFADATVIDHCQRLTYAASLKDHGTDRPIFTEDMLSGPRNRFMLTAVMIAQRLLLTALGTAHVKRQA